MMTKEKLGNLCDVLNGYAFKSSKYVRDGIRVIRITNVQKGIIEDSDPKYYPIDEKEDLKNYLLCENDLLISLTGNVGRVGLLGRELLPSALNQRVGCLRIKDKNKISMRYLFQALNSNRFELDCINSSKGIAQKNLSTEWLKEYEISIPSMEEQNTIAQKLENVQSIIDMRKKQLEDLNNLIKSQFVEMFEDGNYERIEGEKLFTFSSGKFLEAGKRLENGIPVYGGNGIAWYTNEPLINHNTIVIGRVGAYCGNVKLIKEPAWITDNAIFIKSFKKDVFNIDFLYYMMELINFSQFAQFSGQPKITQKPLEEYKYIVPPIDEQIKFSNFVEHIDKLEFELKKSIEEMQNLFDSLMAEYFE